MNFASQDRVLVIDGPLRGLEGVVESVGFPRIALRLDFIGRHATVMLKSQALKLISRPLSRPEVSSLQEITTELMAELAKNPDHLHELSSRRFEEVICELFRDFGYDTKLTPQTRDGGRDILAVLKTPVGEELTIVECKRYKKSIKIGVDVIQRLLWVAREEDRASCAVLATTSTFSPDATAMERRYDWILKLKDFFVISEWLRLYGKWETSPDSGIWTPKR